jgi:hypothetical protein
MQRDEGRRAMPVFAFALLLGASFSSLSSLLLSCRGKATREECTQMIDRYLDLVIAEDPDLAKLPPKQLAAAREMKRELKLGDAKYRKVHDRCAEVRASEARCALAAEKAGDWEACVR